ncbi:MAG: STAS domain-containing protein [Myxococcales bacterium]|nr:STAS domain-containing protein [Myxococcales bacterium]
MVANGLFGESPKDRIEAHGYVDSLVPLRNVTTMPIRDDRRAPKGPPLSAHSTEPTLTESQGPGWTYVALRGTIGGTLPPLRDPPQPLVLVDLDGVGRVTSSGGRELGRLFATLGARDRHVVVIDAPPPVVGLMNLMRGFLGPATILSFKAPYFCERCGREQALTIPVEAVAGSAVSEAPPLLCEEDGTPLSFDDIEKSYFAFATRVNFARVTPELGTLIESARLAGRATHATGAAPVVEVPPEPDLAPEPPVPVVAIELPPADRAFWVVIGALAAVLVLVAFSFVYP